MSGGGPAGGAGRLGPSPGPHPPAPRLPGRSHRRLAVLAATAAATTAVLATPLAAAASHQPRSSQPPPQLQGQLPTQPAPPGHPGGSPPLATTTSTVATNNIQTLVELLGPSLAQAATQLLTAASAAAQRYLDQQLSELSSGGCPAASAVLRAYLYGAGLQVATLGLATRFLMLDRAAVARGQIWRLATWSLMHAGPLHFAANYAALAKLGPQLEKVAGAERFTAVYCGSAAAATVLSLALNGGRPSLGSSGAVFGVAAALWQYHAVHSRVLPSEATAALRAAAERTIQSTAVYHMMLWSRLDVSAHIGGAMGGWFLSRLLGPDYRLEKATSPSSFLSGLPLIGTLLRGGPGPGGGAGLGTGPRVKGDAAGAAAAGPKEVGGGRGLVLPGMVQFRDRPRWPVLADPAPRGSILFPVLGPGYSVAAVTAATAAQGGAG